MGHMSSAAREPDSREHGDSAETPAASSAPKRHRILVVDDDAYVHVGIRAALRALRAEIRTASSGREALEIARAFRPHVAILDVGLPDTDGYQLADDLRSVPALSGLRIIFLTGYLPDRLSVDVAGGNLFLGKPYRMHVLLEAVTRQLGAVAAGE